MTQEDIERVYSLDTEGLWNEFSTMYHDEQLDIEIYEDCKYGTCSKNELFFDIRIYIKHEDDEKYVKRRPKTKEITINKQRYKYQDFLDELERRESIMRSVLIEYYSEEENKEVAR